MSTPLEKFQDLLRELFQFDCADLDFGIYRIMNHKRDVIERFFVANLPNAVAEELEKGAAAEQVQSEKKLQEIRKQIGESFGHAAIDTDGNLAEMFHNTPLGKSYFELMAKSAGGQGQEALEAAIFNHLYAFFSRYYQDGDFISKRRYSKRHRYAIPYNGEEVHLHWANSDQYYVKTGEHFQNYAFKSRRVTVEFMLNAADVEKDNVKGDKRYFVPCNETPTWDEESRRLAISFEYRPLTSQEKITYGNSNQQDNIINKAVSEIPSRLNHSSEATAALMAERRKKSDGKSVSFFEHHLLQYTRRNTSDFFIHKDLKGFLTRELDFYLKNEVLNLDEMEASGEERSEGWFQTMRTMRSVGGQIIDFLDQIENFQKMLWEKPKFVTETQYCITVSCIDEVFFKEIALCDAQWEEWRELFNIDEDQVDLFKAVREKVGRRVAFLRQHPTLVLDTRHFERDFIDRLLGRFGDLDGMTNGVLIQSENWQALNLMQGRYRNQITSVYIDPPYNTFATKILYKNEYEHSTWLSLLQARLSLSLQLLSDDAITCTTIDDYEFHRMMFVLESVFGPENYLATVVIRNNPSGRSTVKGISINHEYGLFFSRSSDLATVGRMPHTEVQKARYRETDKKGRRFEWENFRKSSAGSFRQDRPKQYFPIHCHKQNQSLRIPRIEWQPESQTWQILENPTIDEFVIFPKDSYGRDRVWRYGINRTSKILQDAQVKDTDRGTQIYTKKYLQSQGLLPRTWWDKEEYSARDSGTKTLVGLFGSSDVFDFPKAPVAIMDSIRVCDPRLEGIILDYFAGSGTTGHAVINLNREDEGRRKFVLVEMGQYFDSVLLRRIKKITFAPEWKQGKPTRMATPKEAERGPRIVKYLRLESYEDALNNIDFDEASAQQTMRFHEYLLKYMLKWETRRSETLLNVEKLSKPFSYLLNIHSDGQTRQKIADIPETFNYLIGLHVQTRHVHYDDDRRYLVYRGQIDERRVAVIWRETENWQKADFERDRDFVGKQKLTEDADDVYVNGDSFIREAKALEPLFKRRMFAGTVK